MGTFLYTRSNGCLQPKLSGRTMRPSRPLLPLPPQAVQSDGPSTSGRLAIDREAALLKGMARQYRKGIQDESLFSKLDLDAVTLEGERDLRVANSDASLQIQMVQWYPGHIAKAERQLKEQLKMVDVVLEVRDARIPMSTCHPQVSQWVGSKPRIVVFNRADMISKKDLQQWDGYFAATGQQLYWTSGKSGSGVKALEKSAVEISTVINAKRARRGLKPRPVRAVVIGFPNIGKSALINRLLGRRVVESAAKPGVTRVLRWVRLGGDLDLLDAPGVIPASFNDQQAAQRLAMCNDIGQASYVESLIASALLVRFKQLPSKAAIGKRLQERYNLDIFAMTAEDFVVELAQRLFNGDKEQAGARILNDYRNGRLGEFALEVPADVKKEAGAEDVRKKSSQ